MREFIFGGKMNVVSLFQGLILKFSMLFQLTQYSDIALFFLRVVVAAIFAYHALPKLKNPGGMAQGMGWPFAMVVILGAVELVSSIGILLGAYIQIAAALLIFVMIGAIVMKITKWKTPFSAYDKTGWEFDLILLAANFLLLVLGSGMIGIR